jgi:hypothetical protein
LSINRPTQFVLWLGKEFYREVGAPQWAWAPIGNGNSTLASMAVIAYSLFAKSCPAFENELRYRGLFE